MSMHLPPCGILILSAVLAAAPELKPPSREPAQDAAEIENRLTATLEKQHSAGYYTSEQVRELSQLTAGVLSRVSDEGTRARLLQNTLDYAAVNHASKALVRILPDSDEDKSIEVLRPPSAWTLYKSELEKRLSLAAANPKTPEMIAQMEAQADRLVRASDLRLAALVEGPGADEYRKAWAARFREQLGYYAGTSLELLLPRPLSEAELREAEHKIATFVPADSTPVRIEDPRQSPYAAGQLTDFGILSAVQIYFYGLIQDTDVKDEKYMALARQMKEDLDVLQESIRGGRSIEIPGKEVTKSYPSKVQVTKKVIPDVHSNPARTPARPRADEVPDIGSRKRVAWILAAAGLVLVLLWVFRRRPKKAV